MKRAVDAAPDYESIAMKATRSTLRYGWFPVLILASLWAGTTKTADAAIRAIFGHPWVSSLVFTSFVLVAIWIGAYRFHRDMSKVYGNNK